MVSLRKSSIKAHPIDVSLEFHLNRNQYEVSRSEENDPDIGK